MADAPKLDLPDAITALLFDLDGVLTKTAVVHDKAWKQTFDGFLEARAAGLRRAVVSSSANCQEVLEAAGIEDLFEARIDGNVADAKNLKGKPAPDTFLAGAEALGVEPAAACVFEDAVSGVEAGAAGHFGHVVGVDRVHHADALRAHGADVVVDDLGQLILGGDDGGSVA